MKICYSLNEELFTRVYGEQRWWWWAVAQILILIHAIIKNAIVVVEEETNREVLVGLHNVLYPSIPCVFTSLLLLHHLLFCHVLQTEGLEKALHYLLNRWQLSLMMDKYNKKSIKRRFIYWSCFASFTEFFLHLLPIEFIAF